MLRQISSTEKVKPFTYVSIHTNSEGKARKVVGEAASQTSSLIDTERKITDVEVITAVHLRAFQASKDYKRFGIFQKNKNS